MTLAPDRPTGPSTQAQAAPDLVTVTVDGFELWVPKGTLIIRAAEQLGVQIPRFCDHPLLDPIGACRQCLVEVEGQRKPVASCTTTVADGMVVKTQLSSPVADKAQQGNMEMLLINHPLDCPICDKGGECPLQNQAMSNGRADSRFRDVKRTYPKPIAISSQVLLDRERCVLCARCTRFSEQVAGDPFIELFERGALEQVAIYTDEPFESYFSGNTVQICPVGALTSAAYRFRARPFDLMSTPTVCEHCASGCAQRTDWRRGKVMRRLAAEDPAVNEEWNCDKGRFAFTYATQADRLTVPLVRDETSGELVETSWTDALERAAEGLREARDRGGVGVLPGGRLTLEDAYAYAKFARVALETNDVDARARPHSAEELDFLAARVAGLDPAGGDAAEAGAVTYGELEAAPAVLLVGLEPEEESPIVFLRLRKAARKRGLGVFTVAPWLTGGVRKAFGTLLATVPGDEPRVLRALADPDRAGDAPVVSLPAETPASTVSGAVAAGRPGPAPADVAYAAAEALRLRGAVILVGERAADVPGTLTAAAALAAASGARLAWVPRRAGERGAVDAGALPTLLPGARRVADDAARGEVEARWGRLLPTTPGRDTAGVVAAAAAGELSALLVGGVDVDDLPDPVLARQALSRVGFVVSLEVRRSSVTEHADVVLPVAPAVEKAGTYVNWEGRRRPFVATLHATGALPDARVLHALADELDVDLGLRSVEAARAELDALGTTRRARGADPSVFGLPASPGSTLGSGQAVLASWRLLLDRGSLQDGEPYLAGTAREPVAVVSAGTAAELGVVDGAKLTVRTGQGAVTLPARVAPMPDRVVWLPANSPGSTVRPTLGVGPGAVVQISGGAA
ncbi:MAG TPA: NADH-quinone oxidoreductase subunit G [Mycobacteriales bacterium]|nr:NADH-quinone oxidoreductase subunit G [Mycobacteriales bacterium]